MASYSEKINIYRQKNRISIASIERNAYNQQQGNLNEQKSREICAQGSADIQSSNLSSSIMRETQFVQNNPFKISDIPQESQQYVSSRANESPKNAFSYNDQCPLKREFLNSSAFHLKPQPVGKNNQHPLSKSMISAICVSQMGNQDLDHSHMFPLVFSQNGDLNHNSNKDIQRFLVSIKQCYAQMKRHILLDFQSLKDSYMTFAAQLSKLVQQKLIQTARGNNDEITQKNKLIETLRKNVEAAEKQLQIFRKRTCPKCENRQRQSRTKSKTRSKENEEIYSKEKISQLQTKLQETRKTCERLRYSLKDKQNKESQLIGDNKILTQKLKEIMQKYENLERDLQQQPQKKSRKNSVNIKLLKKYSQNQYLREIDSAQENRSRARSDAVKNSPDKDSMVAPTLQYRERQYVENIAEEQDETVDYQFAKKSASFKANEEKSSDKINERQNNDQDAVEETNFSKRSSQVTKKKFQSKPKESPYFRKEQNKRIQEYQDDLDQNQYDCEDEYDQNYFNNQQTRQNQRNLSPSEKSDPYSPISRKNKRSMDCQQQQLLESMYVFNSNPNFKEHHFGKHEISNIHYQGQPNRYLKASHLTIANKASHIGSPQTNQFSQIHPNQNNRSINMTKKPLRWQQSNSKSIEKLHKGNSRMQLTSSPTHSPYLKKSTLTNPKQTYYVAKRSYAPSALYNDSQDRYQNDDVYQKNVRNYNHVQFNKSSNKNKSREKKMSPKKRNQNESHQLDLTNFGKASVPIYQYQDRSHSNLQRQKSKKKGIMKIQQKIEKLKKQFSRGSQQY